MKLYKKLVPLLAVLLISVIAVVSIYFVNKNKKSPELKDEGPYDIVDIYMDDINSFTIENSNNEVLTINSRLNSDGIVEFYIPGTENDGMSYSQRNFAGYLSIMLNYSSTTKIDSTGLNLDDYGLSNPEYKVTVNCKNGNTVKYVVGADTVAGDQCYVMVDGDSNIYILPIAKKTFCAYDKVRFYDKVNLNVDVKTLEYVTFERRAQDELMLKCSSTYDAGLGDNVYSIVEPVQIGSGDFLTSLIDSIAELEINSFITLSDEEVNNCGINDPSYKFTFDYSDGTSEFVSFSSGEDFFYGFSSKIGEYFLVPSVQLKNINAPIEDLIYKYVYYIHANEIKQIECTYDDVTFKFELEVEDSLSSDKSTVLLDGRDAIIFNSQGKCYASFLFGAFSCVNIGGIETRDNPKLENPVLSYKITDKTFKLTTIDFVTKDSGSYYCFINGEYTGLFVFSSELYNDGGSDVYSYGIVPAYELLTKAIDENINGIYDLESGDN